MSTPLMRRSYLADCKKYPYLIDLLSEERELLVRNNGDKVDISVLDEKVVGLYLSSTSISVNRLHKVKELCVELKKKGENIEVVIFCSPQLQIKEEFVKDIAWLGMPLPLSDGTSYKKFCKIINHHCIPRSNFNNFDEHLFILEPPNHVCLTSYDMKGSFNHDDPFTRKKVVEMEIARLKSYTLDSVLFSGNYKHVLKKLIQIPSSSLQKKNILLFLTTKSLKVRECKEDCLIYLKLSKWCKEIKLKYLDVEVIHVSCGFNQTLDGGDFIQEENPWFEFPYDKSFNMSLFKKLTRVGNYPLLDHPMVVAFDDHGRFITRRTPLEFIYCDDTIYGKECPNFFDDSDLARQIHDQIECYQNSTCP